MEYNNQQHPSVGAVPRARRYHFCYDCSGSVPEWSIGPDLKSGRPARVSEVRILSLPPYTKAAFAILQQCLKLYS